MPRPCVDQVKKGVHVQLYPYPPPPSEGLHGLLKGEFYCYSQKRKDLLRGQLMDTSREFCHLSIQILRYRVVVCTVPHEVKQRL